MNKLFFFGLVFLTAPVVSNAQISADEIIRQSEDRVRGNTSEATITINIVRPGWSRELTMHAWSKGKQLSMILVQ